jgi:AraC family transcriptional regulator of adaptative response / DNA-3-methyladenine glycosylase II
VAELTPQPDHVRAVLRLDDLRDLTTAVQRCRRVFDLDADPQAVTEQLGADRTLGRVVAKTPGIRVPGTVDGFELATRAVLGQQVSLGAARTLAARLVASHGTPLAAPDGGLSHLFPEAEDIVSSPPDALGMPAARRGVLTALARAVANGEVAVDAGADRVATMTGLLDIRGVGPWTASYIAMRALGDPDVFLPTDLGIRTALERMDLPTVPNEVAELAECWSPWRSYAVMHLWRSL